MNFITFPVEATNLFPAANATNGMQLLTEWNLKSRETVATSPDITYQVGLSYTHGLDDFKVRILQSDSGSNVNNYTLEILEGRGIINGHYVETLTPMTVDLVEANIQLQSQQRAALSGALAIGFKTFFATEETVAGTILIGNTDNMYVGIQTVILPDTEFITPTESPTDPSKVTADIRLATFRYNNGKITNLVNNKNKIKYIPSNRLLNAEKLVDSSYIRKTGLNSKKIYGFAGKGTNPSTGLDTWEDVTDSLMVWDANPQRTLVKPSYKEAQFITDSKNVYLAMPHKQVEGMTTEDGLPEYYESKVIPLPVADYGTNAPGIVSKSYTQQIKDINNKVDEFRTTLTGKQIYYLPDKDEDTVLPPINAKWNLGDYILVGVDYTADDSSDGIRPPSTMYVILPGLVETITFHSKVENSDEIPSSLSGAQLGVLYWSQEDRQDEPNTDIPEAYPEFFEEGDNVRGTPGADYFRVRYVYEDYTFANFYYTVATAGKREYSESIFVTGEIPLAQESVIGGFLNVSQENTDYGYVYRDDYGRLRLLDYGLLRSGTLAYQLAENITIPSGTAAEEVQSYLNEYVNERIAFPNAKQLQSESPNCIHIYMTLYEEEEETTFTIGNIDSRFNTSVCLHILGTANSKTIINITNCEKFKIDSTIEGSPVINVYRTCLYYDAYVLDYIRTCGRTVDADSNFTGMEDIKLWYEKFDESDLNLLVDNMTVSELDAPIAPDEVDYWHDTGASANDNYYLTALNSITFAGNGDIVKCGMLVANQSTDNVEPGDKIVVADFVLPQGAGLSYPKSCMVNQLKVTGSFVSAYLSEGEWYVTNTLFSAITQQYNQYSSTPVTPGNIAFHSTTTLVPSTIAQTSIPVWETDTYHLFYGGILN